MSAKITKEKQSEYNKRAYQKHRDKRLDYSRRYYQEHREKCMCANKRYYQDHLEEQRASRRRYWENHREEFSERNAKWHRSAAELTTDGAMVGMIWDYTDDVILMTSEKPLIEIAYEIGRTYTACAKRRHILRKSGWTP